MKGLVIKVQNQFFYVKTLDQKIYECEVKGVLRYQKIFLKVGDDVDVQLKEDKPIIVKVFKRKNELERPLIANIDQVLIITASKQPFFNTFLLNKYLWMIESRGLKSFLIFTKKDLLNLEDKKDFISFEKINWYKKIGYNFFWINNNNINQKDLKLLKEKLKNKISVFTGQTGAGKSTTINTILGSKIQKEGIVSKALGRGKHKTRVVELLEYLKYNIKLIDTPGFSAFDGNTINPKFLASNILCFKKYAFKCKFNNCIHINEPKCYIKNLTKENKIPYFIYLDYLRLQKEIKENNDY